MTLLTLAVPPPHGNGNDADEEEREHGSSSGADADAARLAMIHAPSFADLEALIEQAGEAGQEENDNGDTDYDADDNDRCYGAAAAAADRHARRSARHALANLAGASTVQATGVFPPGTGMTAIATCGASALVSLARALAEAAAAPLMPSSSSSAAPASFPSPDYPPPPPNPPPPPRRLRHPLPRQVILGDASTFVFTPSDLIEASALLRPGGQSLSGAFAPFLREGLPLFGLERLTLGLLLAPGEKGHTASAQPPRGVFPSSVRRLCMVPYAQLPAVGAAGVVVGAAAADAAAATTTAAAAATYEHDPCMDMITYLESVRACRLLRVLEVAADMDAPYYPPPASAAAPPAPNAPPPPPGRLLSPPCTRAFLSAASTCFRDLRELRVIARFRQDAPSSALPFDLSALPRLDACMLQNLATGRPAAPPAAAPATFDLSRPLPSSLKSLRLCGFVAVVGSGGVGGRGGWLGGAEEDEEEGEGGGGAVALQLRLEGCVVRRPRRQQDEQQQRAPEVAVLGGSVALAGVASVSLARCCGVWMRGGDGFGRFGEGVGGERGGTAGVAGWSHPRPPPNEQQWARWLARVLSGEGGWEYDQDEDEEEEEEEDPEEDARWEAMEEGSGGGSGGGSAVGEAATTALVVRILPPWRNETSLGLAGWDEAAAAAAAAVVTPVEDPTILSVGEGAA
jgi:hypothetical protein